MESALSGKPRKRARHRLRSLLLVALAMALGCPESSKQGPGSFEPPPPVVEVVRVALEPLEEEARLVGELRADEAVMVQPEIPGVIVAIEFQEGQEVERGAVLFQLRDGEQKARLREAEARLVLAEDEFRRTRRLASRNAAAAAQLERARGELEVARAQVDLARVELERTRIRMPFDGAAGRRLVSPGARVTPDSELVQVVSVKRLQLVFTVPEWAIPRFQPKGRVWASVAPFPGERFLGEIFFMDPSVDPRTRRLLMKARIENPDRRLRPGLFAEVHALLGERQALLVPAEAVVRDAAGPFVWRLDDENRAERVPVELGTHQAGRVEVRSGLAPGDRVVSAGTHKVKAGLPVEVAAPGAGQGAPLAAGGGAAGEGG